MWVACEEHVRGMWGARPYTTVTKFTHYLLQKPTFSYHFLQKRGFPLKFIHVLESFKADSQYDTGNHECHEHHEYHRKNYFFISQILFLMLNFPTTWLVECWLTLAMRRWNRNRVYSSVTPTLTMLGWQERHIVNQYLPTVFMKGTQHTQ